VFDLFNINHVLNVTPLCPNQFEGVGVVYKRIPVSDTGTQKLSNKFSEAFQYIEEVREKNGIILIHCMAGISRSVTITIAYLMAYFNMSMQESYQYVKDKRPAISPNLNFMGQLVEFEKELQGTPLNIKLDIDKYRPSEEQKKHSIFLMEKITRTSSFTGLPMMESPKDKDQCDGGGGSTSNAGPVVTSHQPFVLKPLMSKGRRGKKGLKKEEENVIPEVDDVNQKKSVSFKENNVSSNVPETAAVNN
jgi:dual specificity MAP kinase phosphatase